MAARGAGRLREDAAQQLSAPTATAAVAGTGQDWLLLIYRVPQDPPGRRTYVWRQLKQLGAIYLQHAAAIMPARPHDRTSLGALARKIREMEGECSLLECRSGDPAWDAEIVRRFNESRDGEYLEIAESVGRFEEEIREETGKEHFRYAELEESESDWAKLRRWHARVVERDFFGASNRRTADEALASGHAALSAFTQLVYEREGLGGDQRPQIASPAPETTPALETTDD